MVSYVVTRWAWERRGRPRVLRETLPFAAVSVCSGALLTESSHLAYLAAGGLGLQGIEFGLFVQALYIAANCVTFVLRFLIFHSFIFAERNQRPAEEPVVVGVPPA